MIDAWIHGKIRRSNSVYEDEVVSATIGHLQYFPNELRARIFKRLLNKGFVKLSDDFINANSSECTIKLGAVRAEYGFAHAARAKASSDEV